MSFSFLAGEVFKNSPVIENERMYSYELHPFLIYEPLSIYYNVTHYTLIK